MPDKLKIGILTESVAIAAWMYRALERLADSDCAEFRIVIFDARPKPKAWSLNWLAARRSRLVFGILMRLDRAIFGRSPDAYTSMDLTELFPDLPRLRVEPSRKKWTDRFSERDLAEIGSYDLDILIGIWPGILRGGILTAARFGVWSYHHGDNRRNRGIPAGFWETVESWPETGVILQILTDELDGGMVIYRSFSRTYPLSIDRNRNQSVWTSSSFLARQVKRLHALGPEEFFRETDRFRRPIEIYDRGFYRTPGNLTTAILAVRQFAKNCAHAVQKLLYLDQWFLLYHLGPEPPGSLRGFKRLIPPKDRSWADPHLIARDGRFFLFIEEFILSRKKAHISVIEIDEKGVVGPSTPVLEKPHHLSYPFVFEEEGDFYMVPESCANRTIELYRCKRFPNGWEFVQNLMEDVHACNTTLLRRDGRWWLFTCIIENEGGALDNELFLFHSDRLKSADWIAHPMNPIVSDVKNARPAGRLFERDGRLLRPAQYSAGLHGRGLNINEVVRLDTERYEEKTVSIVDCDGHPDLLGVHTFSLEPGLTVADALKRRRRIL